MKAMISDLNADNAPITEKKSPSLRSQILAVSTFLTLMLLITGALLGYMSSHTLRIYHESMNNISGIYSLNNALERWNSAITDYSLNASEVNRKICTEQWSFVEKAVSDLNAGNTENEALVIDNIRSLYRFMDAEMSSLLDKTTYPQRIGISTVLSSDMSGMRLLTNDLLQASMKRNVQEYPHVVSRNSRNLMLYFMIIFVTTLATLRASIYLAESVSRPVDLLVNGARQIAAGSYDSPPVKVVSNNEIGYLSHVFNDMKSKVSENFRNLQRIIELQELVQNAEMKALQAQINPHFLFNILAVAEESALTEEADQTVDIIENISYMLQYSLKCTRQNSTLEEEFQMTRSYLFLQEKRFGDRIRLYFSVPEHLPEITVPGLSLEPIVENAVKHGVEKMESDGFVEVTAVLKQDCIQVEVKDNGKGIEPELLEAIRRKEDISSRDGSGGIGLMNVIQRMELFYGKKDLVQIESSLSKGTTVLLTYPTIAAEKKGNENVQTADSRR